MKILLFFISILTLTSCCIGNRKCDLGNNYSNFRIIDKTNGNDLLFGSTKIYNKDSITFFSLNADDTIFHRSYPYANPGQDSVLFVEFDYRKQTTVFVRLNNVDIDTLILTYPTITLRCCPDITSVKPISYNNRTVDQNSDGTTILKK